MRIYLGVPDRPGPRPGIIVAQHGPGVDAPIQDAVHRLHREGYGPQSAGRLVFAHH